MKKGKKRVVKKKKSPSKKAHKKVSKHKSISKKSKVKKKTHKNKSSKKSTPKKGLKQMERVPTWIPNFDRLIEGGFQKNSTNLLVGDSGSGKSIFAIQFLKNAIEHGENVLYVTFEEKKEQFYENMATMGWNLEEYDKQGKFTFLEYTPIKVKTMLEEGGGAIENIILEKKISRIVIDSITSFALLFEDELSKREAALTLFSMIRDWDCTSLITLEEDPLYRKTGTSKVIEFEVDSTIAVYLVRDKRERKRFIEITKMRGTDHSKNIYPVKVDKHGYTISKKPTSRAF